MTPELKHACELVFQEHKTSKLPIDWNKDVFRGRISFHLSALAKQTLEKRNIIRTVNTHRKAFTILNPQVANANSFEEAGLLVQNKVLVSVTTEEGGRDVLSRSTSTFTGSFSRKIEERNKKQGKIASTPGWWTKPIFYYLLWPLCAAIIGGLITYLLGLLV